jgi:hypothetical protein
VALDFETNPVLDVTVQVDDTTVGSTPDDTASLTLNVTNVNESPTITTTSTPGIVENQTDVLDINAVDDADAEGEVASMSWIMRHF